MTEEDFPTDWINSEDITIQDRKTTITVEKYKMKFLRWDFQPMYTENTDYVQVTLEVEIGKKSWRREFLDQGLHPVTHDGDGVPQPDGRGGTAPSGDYVPGSVGNRRLIDRFGNVITEPVPFNGHGGVKDPARRYKFVYSKWGFYNEIDPSAIGFMSGVAQVPSP